MEQFCFKCTVGMQTAVNVSCVDNWVLVLVHAGIDKQKELSCKPVGFAKLLHFMTGIQAVCSALFLTVFYCINVWLFTLTNLGHCFVQALWRFDNRWCAGCHEKASGFMATAVRLWWNSTINRCRGGENVPNKNVTSRKQLATRRNAHNWLLAWLVDWSGRFVKQWAFSLSNSP